MDRFRLVPNRLVAWTATPHRAVVAFRPRSILRRRDRRLHSLLPPARTTCGRRCKSLADQRTGTAASPSSSSRTMRLKSESVPVAAEFLASAATSRASAWSSRVRAIATPSTPRSRLRWRRFPLRRQFPDDRRRRDRLCRTGWSGWYARPRRPAPTSSADRSWPNFDDELKRGLRRHPAFAPAYDASRPGAGHLWLRQLPDHAVGVRTARRSRPSIFASIFSAVATPISSAAAVRPA